MKVMLYATVIMPTGEMTGSRACLEMAAKGIKNSGFPTCSQLTM